MDVAFTGDTPIEGVYSDYRDFGGVKFPMHIVMKEGGYPTLDIAVADVTPNSPAALAVRAVDSRPSAQSFHAGFFGNVFEVEVPPVQIQPAGDHIAGEKDIGQAVVVEVADADPAAVVDIDDIHRVEGVILRDLVVERDTGL